MAGDETMAKVILYRRVSCARQIEGESLEAQHAKLLAWASKEGHEVIADLCDAGISGSTMAGRPGATEAMTLAIRHRAIIAVSSLSRWGRSTGEVITTCEALTKAGAGLVSLGESFDLSSTVGRLLLAILAAVATWELETTRERTVMTLAHMRREGRVISGTPPFGWLAQGDYLVEIPGEQQTLIRMQHLRAAGRSYQYIATTLNDDLVPAKLGGRWSARAVRLILGRLAKLTAA
jgi:site-specific DNA recombinase